jgi:hypothetical protein
MQNHFTTRNVALAAAVTAIAVCASAVAAHVAIDVAGDFVLARDAYDGVAHASRGEMAGVASLGIACVLLWVVRSAYERSRGRCGTRTSIDDVLGRNSRGFVLAVVALSIPVLAAMECLDVISSGGAVDDVADLFGGSIGLGLGMTAVVAATVAITVRRLARLVLDSRDALALVISQLFTLLSRVMTCDDATTGERGIGLQIGQRSILAKRSAKRGPPLPI